MMLFYVFLWGCTQEKQGEVLIEEPEVSSPEVVEEQVDEGGWENPSLDSGRIKKRMTVAQIRDSMEQITGIVWGNNGSDWDRYADSLGVPDYQQRMSEDLSASVMFQKFLNDAATESCLGWMNENVAMFVSEASLTDVSEVLSNIEHFRWLIQGHAKGSEAVILDDYLDLHQSVLVRTQDPMEAWHSVCVALFTHPDFWMF
jgi:hypothetical protein